MSSLLIFEPEANGHPREWLDHLAAHLRQMEPQPSVAFAVAHELAAGLEAALGIPGARNFRVIKLAPTEQALCRHRNLAVSGFARWRTMRNYLALTGAEAGFFMGLDHLSLPLALGFGRRGPPLSGILFRPSVHYRTISNYRPGAVERVRDIRKNLLYRLMLRNGAVERVLSLDPYFPAFAATHYPAGDKVAAIPDPAHPISKLGKETERALAAARGDRIGLLMFGALTARKGVMQLISALGMIPPEITARLSVVIAGNVETGLTAPLRDAVQRLNRARGEIWVRLEDRWLSNRELGALLHWTDVVLAPYQRFVGSSGVMLWSAASGKPLLTQEFGLLGRLTAEHRLGLTVDTANPTSLAAGIVAMVVHGPAKFIDIQRAQRFAEARSATCFAETILDEVGFVAPPNVPNLVTPERRHAVKQSF